MSFDWLSYLRFAETILSKVADFPDHEAVYRTVTSRAYYAVFCSARDLVKELDDREFFGNVHQELYNYLKNSRHNALRRRIGNRLQQLHHQRIRADYEDATVNGSIYQAQAALKMAKNIESDLNNFG